MKFAFESEDCIYGIIIGMLVIGFSGKYFNVPNIPYLWGALFAVAVILTILDIFHTFTDLGRHPIALILVLLNNLIDGALQIAYMGKFFKFSIPKLSAFINPYLANNTYVFYIGVFFVVTSFIWLIVWPMTE